MMNTPLYLERIWGQGETCPFEEIIDVRSPSEFAEDHIPGAINLPVLTDSEREEVGTIYRQINPFTARKRGAAYVSANIGRHLNTHFADKNKDYKPLVYCWRGGQRSASLAIVLTQIGWRVTVLQGGYKTYRTHVMQQLDLLPKQFHLQILAGATGSAKTRVLQQIAVRGGQVLDLEGLANHCGSILGDLGPQPSQKYFDSLLLQQFQQLDPSRPVWVEAESNRIGDLYLPPGLWHMMGQATGVQVVTPMPQRVQYLISDYSRWLENPDWLKQTLSRLAPKLGEAQVQQWHQWIDQKQWPELVESLLRVHYDPGYAASALRCYPHVLEQVPLEDSSPTAIDRLVSQLINMVCSV